MTGPTRDAALDVRGVTVVHHRHGSPDAVVAVRDVSLSARKGEVVGVIGESGSGKTSLAMVIAGLRRPTGGTVSVGGIVPSPSMARDDRAAIQVVFQDPHGSLDPRQTIGGGIRELRALHPRRSAWLPDEELMARVKLTTKVFSRFPHQLSGGEAQRVCIARALLLRPRLLIADEPTSSLDVSVQAQLLTLFLGLRAEHELTILFISHDMGVVRALCDSVHVMRQGSVVESGPTLNVLRDPKHEYTRALIAAIPGIGRTIGASGPTPAARHAAEHVATRHLA